MRKLRLWPTQDGHREGTGSTHQGPREMPSQRGQSTRRRGRPQHRRGSSPIHTSSHGTRRLGSSGRREHRRAPRPHQARTTRRIGHIEGPVHPREYGARGMAMQPGCAEMAQVEHLLPQGRKRGEDVVTNGGQEEKENIHSGPTRHRDAAVEQDGIAKAFSPNRHGTEKPSLPDSRQRCGESESRKR